MANSRGSTGVAGDTEDRVEFLSLAFKHRLVEAIIRYELWDEGWEGLGERQFDACFEMGDGTEVVAALIKRAGQEGFLDAIQMQVDQETFARWLQYENRQKALF